MSSWPNISVFVISTICSLGAMVGLIVVSTISPHDHHGLLRPTLLMGDIPVATARSGHHLDNSISAALLPKAAGIDEASSFNPRLSISPQDSSRHLIKQQSQQWGRRPRRHGSSPLLTRSAAPYGTSTDAPNTGGPSRAPTAALDTSSVVFTPTDDPNGTCTPAYGSQHSHIGTTSRLVQCDQLSTTFSSTPVFLSPPSSFFVL